MLRMVECNRKRCIVLFFLKSSNFLSGYQICAWWFPTEALGHRDKNGRIWSGGIETRAIFIVFQCLPKARSIVREIEDKQWKKIPFHSHSPLGVRIARLTWHRHGMPTVQKHRKVVKSSSSNNALYLYKYFPLPVLAMVQFLKSLSQYEVQTTWFAFSKAGFHGKERERLRAWL